MVIVICKKKEKKKKIQIVTSRLFQRVMWEESKVGGWWFAKFGNVDRKRTCMNLYARGTDAPGGVLLSRPAGRAACDAFRISFVTRSVDNAGEEQ